jgi:phage terminase small subunit
LAIIPVAPEPHRVRRLADQPAPPLHLGQPEQQIWRDVLADLPHAPTSAVLAILRAGLEAHQRARLAAEAISRDGMTVCGRDGQQRAHPLLAVERDARQAYVVSLKAVTKPPPKRRKPHDPGGFGWQPGHFDVDDED